jgi:hypothetical protein
MIEKLSPQERRKNMICAMARFLVYKDGISGNPARYEFAEIKDLKNEFMFEYGASKVRTDEYFDICVAHHKYLEFNEDRTKIRIRPQPTVNPQIKEENKPSV